MLHKIKKKTDPIFYNKIKQDAKVLTNINYILEKIEEDGYLYQIQNNFLTILENEIIYSLDELKNLEEKDSKFDMKSQLTNNTFIFKENLKKISNFVIDQLWREKIKDDEINLTIKKGLKKFGKESFGKIEEADESKEDIYSDSILDSDLDSESRKDFLKENGKGFETFESEKSEKKNDNNDKIFIEVKEKEKEENYFLKPQVNNKKRKSKKKKRKKSKLKKNLSLNRIKNIDKIKLNKIDSLEKFKVLKNLSKKKLETLEKLKNIKTSHPKTSLKKDSFEKNEKLKNKKRKYINNKSSKSPNHFLTSQSNKYLKFNNTIDKNMIFYTSEFNKNKLSKKKIIFEKKKIRNKSERRKKKKIKYDFSKNSTHDVFYESLIVGNNLSKKESAKSQRKKTEKTPKENTIKKSSSFGNY